MVHVAIAKARTRTPRGGCRWHDLGSRVASRSVPGHFEMRTTFTPDDV